MAQIEGPVNPDYPVLQHPSALGPFFPGPGLVLRFDSPAAAPTVVANCLARPTSMLFDESSAVLYVTEMLTGRVVALQLGG